MSMYDTHTGSKGQVYVFLKSNIFLKLTNQSCSS